LTYIQGHDLEAKEPFSPAVAAPAKQKILGIGTLPLLRFDSLLLQLRLPLLRLRLLRLQI
jgi:hypothetical protein